MATSHAISVVKNHCYNAPRISNTNRPATAKEFNQEQRKRALGDEDEVKEQQNDVLLTRSLSRTATVGRYAYAHDKHKSQASSLSYHEKPDAVSEEQFYQNLVKLKAEHKKTLKLLETKYYDELRNQNSFQWEGFSHGVGLKQHNGAEQDSSDGLEPSFQPLREYNSPKVHERVFHKPPKSPAMAIKVQDVVKDMSSHDSTIDCEDQQEDHSEDSDENEEISGTDKDPRSPEEFSSSLFPERSAAIDMVEDLWKDFSVRDYTASINDESLEPRELEKPKEKEWSPAITVPKPFAMTLREATKEKRTTRSMKMIEEELVLRKSMEQAELQKSFRAQPVPATTFLPLYDEIMEKNNRRSEHVREINKAILKATEKPFGFVRREEEKKRRKEIDEKMAEKEKAKDESRRAVFKARPPPKHMDDLSLADRRTEQDEYRKIRTKLRAAELLTRSRLPPSMEARANISPAAKSRQKCQRIREEQARSRKPKFRPDINPDVPDFDALHWEFEKELRRKKKERQPTVVEPFNLRTARVPRGESCMRRTKSMENLTGSLDSPMQSGRKSRPLSARLSSSQDTLPFGTTESVRLRDNAVRKSLELRKQRDTETSREVKEKRKREKQLRSQVSVKAMANDHSWQLRKTKEGKLKSFRETDRGRKEEYENELAEMQRRVAHRPLLLEQESRANAKRKAERKYTQILRDAGVDENLVSRLVTKDGKIVDEGSGDDECGAINYESREDPRGLVSDADVSQDYFSEESDDGDESEVEYDEKSL